MSGASALYLPSDPNTAPGTHELGTEKSGFKNFDEKIYRRGGMLFNSSLDGDEPIDRPPFGGPDQAVVSPKPASCAMKAQSLIAAMRRQLVARRALASVPVATESLPQRESRKRAPASEGIRKGRSCRPFPDAQR